MTGVRDFAPDRWLDEGDTVSIGELTFDILHCPGHSPGSVVLSGRNCVCPCRRRLVQRWLVGCTDLPGGSHATLIKSITESCCRSATMSASIWWSRRRVEHRPGTDDQSILDREQEWLGGYFIRLRGGQRGNDAADVDTTTPWRATVCRFAPAAELASPLL